MRSLKVASLGVVAALVTWGCAAQSRSAAGAAAACEPVPAEFSLPGQVVYRECAVDRRARELGPGPRLNYTPSVGETCARAVIDVVVDASGRPVTETAKVVRSTGPAIATAVLSSLGATRYEPALKDGLPVPQLVRVDRGIMSQVVVVGPGRVSQPRRPPRRAPC